MRFAACNLISIAQEMAQRAKDSLPALRENEVIKREWLADGAFHRETELEGRRFISSFNFKEGVTLTTESGKPYLINLYAVIVN